MNLKDLKDQLAKEEQAAKQPQKAPPAIEPEDAQEEATAEQDSESQATAETEPTETLELEIEGEQEESQSRPANLDPVKVLEYKLGKERKKKREAREELEELRKQNELLQQQLQQAARVPSVSPQQPAAASSAHMAEPTIPDLYDKGIDGDRQKYDAAMKKWFADYQAYQNRHKEAEAASSNYRSQLDRMTRELAEKAAKFATTHNVKIDTVADALERATTEIDDSIQVDGALALLLDSVGEGSERVAYYLGTNAAALNQVKQLLKDDPKGFKTVAHMTRLANKLKPKAAKAVSNAPEPDRPLRGDSSANSPSAKKLQADWEKAKTPDEMLAVRKKARELGIKL